MEYYTFKKLAAVDISEVDCEILKRIARHEEVSIAHALTAQLSGLDFYEDWLEKETEEGVVLRNPFLRNPFKEDKDE